MGKSVNFNNPLTASPETLKKGLAKRKSELPGILRQLQDQKELLEVLDFQPDTAVKAAALRQMVQNLSVWTPETVAQDLTGACLAAVSEITPADDRQREVLTELRVRLEKIKEVLDGEGEVIHPFYEIVNNIFSCDTSKNIVTLIHNAVTECNNKAVEEYEGKIKNYDKLTI